MKAAVYNTQFYERSELAAANRRAKHELIFFDEAFAAGTVELATGCDAISISIHDRIDRNSMQKLSSLGIKAIVLRCKGYENVDLDAANQHDIKVLRVPDYSAQSVAEHAVAMIMTLNRKTHHAYNKTRSNDFSLNHLIGFDLCGKTIGVVGTGKIGSAFCQIMLGFGCKVIAYDIVESDMLKAKGVIYSTFDDLLSESDIISIHCPLNESTYHLFDSEAFFKMKPGAMLINTGRGAIIDTVALLGALKMELLGYVGLDVYEWENDYFHMDYSGRIVQDDFLETLLSFRNVLITPHQAFFTREAISQICATTIQNLTAMQLNKELENEVKAGKKIKAAT